LDYVERLRRLAMNDACIADDHFIDPEERLRIAVARQ
jgi:hypothetical protein